MYNLKSILYKKFRADSAEVLILLQKTMLAGNFSPHIPIIHAKQWMAGLLPWVVVAV